MPRCRRSSGDAGCDAARRASKTEGEGRMAIDTIHGCAWVRPNLCTLESRSRVSGYSRMSIHAPCPGMCRYGKIRLLCRAGRHVVGRRDDSSVAHIRMCESVLSAPVVLWLCAARKIGGRRTGSAAPLTPESNGPTGPEGLPITYMPIN
eukprot:7138141-Prymnesium_polylepis.1